MKARKQIIWLLVLIALLILGVWIKRTEEQQTLRSQVQKVFEQEVENELEQYVALWEGTEFPTLHTTDLDNQRIQLATTNQKPRLYVVWASWCSDCQRELPYIEKLYQNYQDRVEIITIALIGFREETTESALNYYHTNKFTFPVYFDEDQSVARELDVKAIPTLYFVDVENRITKIIIETVDQQKLNGELSTLLDE